MDDRRLEIIIGNLLRAGVLLAAAVVLAGGIAYLAQNHGQAVSYRTFIAGGDDTRTLAGIARSAAHLHSEGIIQFGLLLLIATPVARVALAVVGFSLERDRLYALVSLIVLAILAFSLLHAT
ncbi:MAG TPA: DUF1634 domain-containing protein [Terracidiphilus sp.]|nr:DUF1634 domain-containing protein [Terracidiphilus sp.]